MVKLPGMWGYDLDNGGPLSVAGQPFEEGPSITGPNNSIFLISCDATAETQSRYLQSQLHVSGWFMMFMITSPTIKPKSPYLTTIIILSHTSNHHETPLFG